LVQFEIVHVATCADLRCVHDDEDMVRVHMDSRNVVAVPAFADRHWMKFELLREQHLGDELPSRSHLLDLDRRSILDNPEIVPYAVQPPDKVGLGLTEPTKTQERSDFHVSWSAQVRRD
jgi:hypothetical protein